MVAISKENKVFLSEILSAVRENMGNGSVCGSQQAEIDTLSISELCEALKALTENSTALERMSRKFRYREWSTFYDYLKSIEIGVDMWLMPSFDARLIFRFCDLVRLVYERTNEADFAYLYACILFDMAYEEIYQESLLDVYTHTYIKKQIKL